MQPPDYFNLVIQNQSGDSMTKKVWLTAIIALGFAIAGCNGSGSNQPVQPDKTGTKSTLNDTTKDKELALKFLQGAQNGDKEAMYAASNLTTALVTDSREKLIHNAKYNQADAERKASEEILRISGQIDYFGGKLRQLFPKSATFQITKTENLGVTAGIKRLNQTATVTYSNQKEALSDKTGRQVKVMNIQLLQTIYSLNDRAINSFWFAGKGYDKIVDKDFEVVSYY